MVFGVSHKAKDSFLISWNEPSMALAVKAVSSLLHHKAVMTEEPGSPQK